MQTPWGLNKGTWSRCRGGQFRLRENTLADFSFVLRCPFRTTLMMVHEVPMVKT